MLFPNTKVKKRPAPERGALIPMPLNHIPMPPVLEPKNRRIKTIVKEYRKTGVMNIEWNTNKFDNEVNEATKSGWELDEIKLITKKKYFILYALLHRYERAETEGADNVN